jgi:phosphoglucomutase
MSDLNIQDISTQPFADQKPGTSGLRKKTCVFVQPHYIENFTQSVFDAVHEGEVEFAKEILVIGGDGRYYNRTAIDTILRMAVANGFGQVWVAGGGLLSTPAMSAVIRRHGALGGLVLSASHNPGGLEADFGIKYNIRNGGPAPAGVTDSIFRRSSRINRYRITGPLDLDLNRESVTIVNKTRVVVFNPVSDYVKLMEELFDIEALRTMFKNGFRLLFDAMNAVTGPYAHHIFEDLLGAQAGSVVNGTPLEDFGGIHPDPNQVHASELVNRMDSRDAPDFGAACDGDGDRNMVLGKSCFVTPGDSLAIITQYARDCIPGYGGGLTGVARSMPTSTAVDKVAARLGIPCYETPTGWKFFGNLMDAGLCTICGEESFGTGSNHVREKDGLWAVLCWLSILAKTHRSVSEVVKDHWRQFGRCYYQRHDYEGLDPHAANQMMLALAERLSILNGTPLAGSRVTQADDFSYTDPVDGSVSQHQGLRVLLEDGSRLVCRLSGTGTEGAILRLYVERYRNDGGKLDAGQVLAPLVKAGVDLLELKKWCGRDRATVIT